MQPENFENKDSEINGQNPESFRFPPEDGGIEAKESQSERLQRDYLQAVEKDLENEFLKDHPPIPETKRIAEAITGADGEKIGIIEKIREPWKMKATGREPSWLILDYDDVLNFTSDRYSDLAAKIEEATGMSKEEWKELYESSKRSEGDGKAVLRIHELRQKLLDRFPEKKESVQNLFDDPEGGKYINPAMRRMLVLLRGQNMLSRISILTYGEIADQKKRIEQSGIAELVDDLILTEGSKRETLEALVAKQYPTKKYRDPQTGKKKSASLPDIITVDDSPEHLDDYANLSFKERYANIRFKHPKAKRADKPHNAEGVITSQESAPNEAALQLYYMMKLAGIESYREKMMWYDDNPNTRDKIYALLKTLEDPEKRWDTLSYIESDFPDEQISYHQEGEELVRESMRYPTPWSYNQRYEIDYKIEGGKRRPMTPWGKRMGESHEREVIGAMRPDGKIKLAFNASNAFGIDAEEFILNAK